MERIFVADGGQPNSGVHPNPKLKEVRAYLYTGWEYDGWGSAPADTPFEGMTGFYFVRKDDSSGPGFGAQVLVDRLRSGLHGAVVVE